MMAEVYASLQNRIQRRHMENIQSIAYVDIITHKRCMYSIIDIDNDDSFTSFGIALRTISWLFCPKMLSRSYYHQD